MGVSFTRVKINTDGVVRDILVLLLVEVFFVGVMEKFIGVFSMFLDVQTGMTAEFYEAINTIKETQKMELTNV